MNKKTMIYVTFQKEGIHCYPAANTDPKLKTGDMYDVSFLGYPHRHLFSFKVSIEVFQNDRDIEFIQFKRWLESLYNGTILNLNSKSCEMISDDLYSEITKKYPNRDIHIIVSEDNENGSDTFYYKDGSQTEDTTPNEKVKVEGEKESEKPNLDGISFDNIKLFKDINPSDLLRTLSSNKEIMDSAVDNFISFLKNKQ